MFAVAGGSYERVAGQQVRILDVAGTSGKREAELSRTDSTRYRMIYLLWVNCALNSTEYFLNRQQQK